MKKKILIVDDEENIRFTLDCFLSDAGHIVETAETYDEAVSWLDASAFDVIFADILLSGKTGIDLLSEVKRRELTAPVVIITGAPTFETAARAVQLGAFDYVAKPVRQRAILHIAGRALSFKAAIEEKERYRRNLEAIFRSVKDGIITVDDRMQVVEANASARRLCGISEEKESFRDSLFPSRACAGECAKALSESVRRGKTREIFRLNCRSGRQPEQTVSITTTPLLTDDRKPYGGVMVVRDETRLAGLEQGLKERKRFHGIVGKSPRMQEIYDLIETLSDVSTTALVTGKSGTGKELVAEALHYGGLRMGKPLVKVNCSALSEGLLESELFGHVKGAFTGAEKDKIGRFEMADGGTIFLDEIGETPKRTQLRLLRVLAEMEFERVGDASPIRVDARIVAATNSDLEKAVAEGRFREDLYYRLKVMEVRLPPLCQRKEDIPLLTEHFIERFNQKLHQRILGISDRVRKIFVEHSWPGNVRELEHSLEHAFILAREERIIRKDHLPSSLMPGSAGTSETQDQRILLDTLRKTRWNKSEAARLLGISRQTFYRKIKAFNLTEI